MTPIGEEIKLHYKPLGSGDIIVNHALVNRLAGRILQQVENHGGAWYVNPADGKRYYMKNGRLAYQIMRYLSLGISNSDLRQIAVRELK